MENPAIGQLAVGRCSEAMIEALEHQHQHLMHHKDGCILAFEAYMEYAQRRRERYRRVTQMARVRSLQGRSRRFESDHAY